MILYQLAKWMEERTRLIGRMKDQRGEAGLHLLEIRKDQLEQRLLAQANHWLEGRLMVSVSAEPSFELAVNRETERGWGWPIVDAAEERMLQTALLAEDGGEQELVW